MKKLFILLILLSLSITALAADIITAFDDKNLPILNEILRKLDKESKPTVTDIIPDWVGINGDMVLYANSTTRRFYIYANEQWNYMGYLDSTGKLVVDGELNIGTTLRADATNGMWLGNTVFGSAPFRVSLAGALTATSATISGSVTAISGAIGGWNITDGYIYNLQSGTPEASPSDGIVMASGNEGIVCYEDTAKRLELGYLSAGIYGLRVYDTGGSNVIFEASDTQQTIGGWTLGQTSFTSGSGATTVGLDSGGTNPAIYCGSATPASAPFRVTNAGALTATSGSIGGWTIGDTTLSTTNLLIDSGNERIRTSNYVSGALGAGWNIDNDIAEFNNIRARGKITTSVFEKEAISIVGGNLIVLGGDILDEDMTALDNSTMTISGDITFAVNDILRIKDDTDDEWFQVTTITSAPTYTVTRDKASQYTADTNPIWKKGTAVVNYGQSGQGGIFLTSSEDNAPYIDFFTHAGAPWTTTTLKTRLGNLSGVPGCSGYGIFGGDGYLGALEVIDIITISNQGAIRSNTLGNYPYLELSNTGLQLKDSDTGGTYGIAVYGTDKYGYGAQVWIMNSSTKIPWMELKEPNAGANDVASIRLYNRSDDPGGAAEIGDLAVVNGLLKICNEAGTPGVWIAVGDQAE